MPTSNTPSNAHKPAHGGYPGEVVVSKKTFEAEA